jgi:hypothetical protein
MLCLIVLITHDTGRRSSDVNVMLQFFMVALCVAVGSGRYTLKRTGSLFRHQHIISETGTDNLSIRRFPVMTCRITRQQMVRRQARTTGRSGCASGGLRLLLLDESRERRDCQSQPRAPFPLPTRPRAHPLDRSLQRVVCVRLYSRIPADHSLFILSPFRNSAICLPRKTNKPP